MAGRGDVEPSAAALVTMAATLRPRSRLIVLPFAVERWTAHGARRHESRGSWPPLGPVPQGRQDAQEALLRAPLPVARSRRPSYQLTTNTSEV
jgi:hypothetical protein